MYRIASRGKYAPPSSLIMIPKANRSRIILTSRHRRIQCFKFLHHVVIHHGGDIFIDGTKCESTQEPTAEEETRKAGLQLVHRVIQSDSIGLLGSIGLSTKKHFLPPRQLRQLRLNHRLTVCLNKKRHTRKSLC
jgi:hypothetical protein